MVSYIQVPQYGVEQGFKGIIKAEDSPRRSNLPSDIWNEFKPVHGEQISGIYRPSETKDYFVTYTRSGKVDGVHKKTPFQKYVDFLKRDVKYHVTYFPNSRTPSGYRRVTPLNEYEKMLGMQMSDFPHRNYQGTLDPDYHAVTYGIPSTQKNLQDYINQKEEEFRIKLEQEQADKIKAEEQRLREEAQQRPNPKEESIASVVEISEPTPVSYLPLGIVAVVVIGVVLLLRRRA